MSYGRFDGFSGRLERVTSDPSKPEQTTETIGAFSHETGTGTWEDYRYIPLRDENGDLAEVELEGMETLRLTSGVFNINFFMLVPL